MWPRSSGRSCNYNGLSKEVSEHKGTYNANTFTGDSDKINKGNKVRVTHTKLCSFECSCSNSEPTGQGQSKGCSCPRSAGDGGAGPSAGCNGDPQR